MNWDLLRRDIAFLQNVKTVINQFAASIYLSALEGLSKMMEAEPAQQLDRLPNPDKCSFVLSEVTSDSPGRKA